jgi:hypothetical protein
MFRPTSRHQVKHKNKVIYRYICTQFVWISEPHSLYSNVGIHNIWEEQACEYNLYNSVYNFKNTASRLYEYSK